MERRRGIDLYKPSYWGKNGRARSLSSGEAKEERWWKLGLTEGVLNKAMIMIVNGYIYESIESWLILLFDQ